ncbi:hypothetical protein D039_2295B, partial [Vibrio parahaemolyticus EKP-028]
FACASRFDSGIES